MAVTPFKFPPLFRKPKTTFGEPLGVPVIKPTHILNQPGGTGLYPGKPKKKKKRKPKNVDIPKRLGVRAVVVDSSNNFLLTLQDILNPDLSLTFGKMQTIK